MNRSELPQWSALAEHQQVMRVGDLRALFSADTTRADRLTWTVGDLTVDFSKHLISVETIDLLVELAAATGVADRRDAMFAGARINTTENREVLHTALRADSPVHADGTDVLPDVRSTLRAMRAATEGIRGAPGADRWLGASGRPIETVVNIGIGGSDLGPLMAVRALDHLRPSSLKVRFVSNVDGAHLDAAIADLDPATTLFVVASKTFTTIETMTNARSARDWVLGAYGGDESSIARHFVALSTNAEGVAAFGIEPSNMFEFWDWVGGRYSLDSAIGFSLMCAIGADAFDDMLAGFRTVDEHFRNEPLASNVPVLSALIGVWYRNFWGWQSHAVLPYCQALDRFPAYLQQLDMESNGKQVGVDGQPVTIDTAPIVWGEAGTNGQHAFYQLLHQGTTPVPCDLIGFLRPEPARVDGIDRELHHRLLFANLAAQAEALAFGKTADEVRSENVAESLVAHKTFPGNRPSTTITAPELTPNVLGQLVAFYEHRVFVQGAVWGINSFDQWGVELGKVLATRIGAELSDESFDPALHDSSTSSLIERFRAANP